MTEKKSDWIDFFSPPGELSRKARLFRDGKSQAVRLPKDLEFIGIEEVLVRRVGAHLVIEPKKPTWFELVDLQPVGDDFLAERPQLGIEP